MHDAYMHDTSVGSMYASCRCRKTPNHTWGTEHVAWMRLQLEIGGRRDGTTSTVLFIGELMKQAERYLGEGLHPRIIVDVSSFLLASSLDWACRADWRCRMGVD